jgi:hypothetical protein
MLKSNHAGDGIEMKKVICFSTFTHLSSISISFLQKNRIVYEGLYPAKK